jgi:hypothetical protein
MKTLLRTAAVLAFLPCFICGLWLLGAGFSAPTRQDTGIPIALGCFFLGMAFFVGAMLLFAAEKLGRNGASK